MNRMSRLFGCIAFAGIGALTLAGCGSGDSSSTPVSAIDRTLFAGNGTASGTGVTTKIWKVVALRGNSKYTMMTGSGGAFSMGSSSITPNVDVPCPVTLIDPANATETLSCGANDLVTVKSDGTFTFGGFGRTWSLNGSALTLDYGAAIGVQTSTLTLETVAGKQRLRIHQTGLIRNGVSKPHDNDSEVIIEEVPAI